MENMSDDDGWEFVNLGDQQSFGIKTAGLEEKATACQMLVGTILITFLNKNLAPDAQNVWEWDSLNLRNWKQDGTLRREVIETPTSLKKYLLNHYLQENIFLYKRNTFFHYSFTFKCIVYSRSNRI